MYEVLIIGAGPAGMSAAIYARRAKLNVAVLEKTGGCGGQVLSTSEVDNYPALPGISGFNLSEEMRKHCDKFDVKFITDEVVGIGKQGNIWQVFGADETYEAKTVIIATGARYAKLSIPGENELTGRGVSYCATCDGAFFRDKVTAVIGGGDVAVEDAIYLARMCKKVYVIHRRNELRAAKSLQESLFACDNVEIIWDTVATAIKGENRVESLVLKDVQTGNEYETACDGVFVAVGILPNSNEYTGHIEVDGRGYIVAGEDCITSEPGVFAAGDVRTKGLRQIITAVSDGANAINSVERYLREAAVNSN